MREISSTFGQYLLRDVLGDVVSFPAWWYTTGAVLVARTLIAQVNRMTELLSLRTLAANIGMPLYGDVTRSGRIISVLVRIGHLGALLGGVFLWGLFLFFVFLFWLLLPVIVVLNLVRFFVAPFFTFL